MEEMTLNKGSKHDSKSDMYALQVSSDEAAFCGSKRRFRSWLSSSNTFWSLNTTCV